MSPKSFAFIFPMASGHVNPSLPVARALVERGHAVHYLVREQMREAVEGTGAAFHSELEALTELYEGRKADLFGAISALKEEYGLEDEKMIIARSKLNNVQLELMLPGVLRFLEKVGAQAVVNCPLCNLEAAVGAEAWGIPSIGLLTTAGPGSLTLAVGEFLAKEGVDLTDIAAAIKDFVPNAEAVRRIRKRYGVRVDMGDRPNPLGYMNAMCRSVTNVVTTSEDLQDPVTPELESKYREGKASFAFVGPLLDKKGAKRASTHKSHGATEGNAEKAERKPDGAPSDDSVVAKVAATRAAGRRVVLVSMGTVVTGDHEMMGWDARMPGPDGKKRGLCGRELCRGAWGGAIDAFGAGNADEGPLIVLSLGPQPEPLGDLVAPPNAVCVPSVPQVDVLRAGVDLFLTHGGQNSFTESMAHGTPVVVCPGFGDQVFNARKAENLGVGLKVDRPDPDAGMEAEAQASYRAAVREALLQVSAKASYMEAAAGVAQRLKQAGGVERAVEIVLATAEARQTSPAQATSRRSRPRQPRGPPSPALAPRP